MSFNTVPLDFVPTNQDELAQCLADPYWRLCSGQLYKIKAKTSDDDESDEGLILPFKPNRPQRRLIKKLWYRNIILKARQMGFTTFIAIYFLDCVLFGEKHTNAAIVAHTEKAAKAIFRDKVLFAYQRLPPALQDAMPLARKSADELLFAHNNSSIQVSVSARSGTLHYLHVSEFGKICAKFPDRADEVLTGSIPAVVPEGMIFIESTAEGRTGAFFKMCEKAAKLLQLGKILNAKQYAFHFFAWWQMPEYVLDPTGVHISKEDKLYFDELETKIKRKITPEQRAWYVETRANDFADEDEKMWQEYPSTPDEPFKVNTQGAYYRKQMVAMRKQRRITHVPVTPSYPVMTFWDIGNTDGTAVWCMQKVGNQFRFVKFIEGWGEPYGYYVRELKEWAGENQVVWGEHYLPHDGGHERQGKDNNYSPREMLEQLGLRNVQVLPQINELQYGIQATRDFMAHCWIDEKECKEGITHLDLYAKKWNSRTERYMDTPDKDAGHSEGADSFRQAAQAHADGLLGRKVQQVPDRRNSSARIV